MYIFVIGLGTRSVPGGLLEQWLQQKYEHSQFNIVPLLEGKEADIGSAWLAKDRAQNYAEELLKYNATSVCIGVTSILNDIKTAGGTVLKRVRFDWGFGMVKHLEPQKACFLNKEHVGRQVQTLRVEPDDYQNSIDTIRYMISILTNSKLTYKS